MKRAALALLAFLGVACIVAAIAIPTYLVPKLKVVPLDLDITSVASTVSADGDAGDRFPATIFDRCSLTKSKAATLDANLTQQRRSVIVDPSDKNQATLQSGQTVQIDRVRDSSGKERDLTMASSDADRKCDDALLNATVDRVSVNRETSAPNGNVSELQVEPIPEGGTVEEASVKLEDRKGFQYKFGFDVQKRDYYYYDTTTRQDATAKFVEEKTIDGVKTYHFVADVPETDLSNLPDPQGDASLGTMLDMPAKWWGIKGRGVKPNDVITMHRYAKATRNVYVEPTTGTIIYGEEDQEQYFKSPDDSADSPAAVRDFRMDALKGRFKWSDATVSQQADRAQGYLNQLRWGGTIVPIILGVLGVLLLLAWALLVWFGRKRGGEPTDDGLAGEPTPDGDGGSEAATPEEQTTVIPGPVAAPYGQYAADDTTVLPATPDESSTQAIPAYDPLTSPMDTSQTEAFSAPADGFGPIPQSDEQPSGYPYPYADPTRPMPDVEQYRQDPDDEEHPGRHER
ncbi:DUF3068 domain-containing protein [Gordonia neofelifaecis]|uniref:DUF3068 domain-containing protein n=1 Tax=Gordonia neofelifaecis NRRL B-59395 TaxID=644548 RepID=F1YK49_9ACTN|nr:DUF3068 domain-containing protein [Gordonia neofelifaecis]EGD54895.1 hypothetical protein SCNU_11830 [Gordonia neofelifaecis NRRL B-59395]